ncbi:hypothetical protein [Candidatus Methylacidiphilum infernorum]|nr:hypothetical protein [Candidatus Methylacidiphilum infernorum]
MILTLKSLAWDSWAFYGVPPALRKGSQLVESVLFRPAWASGCIICPGPIKEGMNSRALSRSTKVLLLVYLSQRDLFLGFAGLSGGFDLLLLLEKEKNWI